MPCISCRAGIVGRQKMQHVPEVETGLMSWDNWLSQYGALTLFLLLIVFLLWRSGFFARLFRIIEEMMFNNWQLALLGATAVALSLASGYTTFDGLRNFTSAPLLSVLIAFGIQGVMLIVAWLIGESFAAGMNQQLPRGKGFSGARGRHRHGPRRGSGRPRLLLGAEPVQRRRLHQGRRRRPGFPRRLGEVRRRRALFQPSRCSSSPSSPSTSGAAATSRRPMCRACASSSGTWCCG